MVRRLAIKPLGAADRDKTGKPAPELQLPAAGFADGFDGLPPSPDLSL